MILIVTDRDEPTTDLVIDWINYLKKDYIRISTEDRIKISKIYFGVDGMEVIFTFKHDNKLISIDTKNITSYWYRRSKIDLDYGGIRTDDNEIDSTINSFLAEEYYCSIKFINTILSRKSKFNIFEDNEIQKLDVLQKARDVNLRVPDTVVCSKLIDLEVFYNKYNGRIITKSIGDPTSFFHKDLHQFTSKVSLDELPDTFGISLFQEMIDKIIELRIFFFDDKYYGSAIFSQLDPNTKIDLKNYNLERPARVVPYDLSDEIIQRLKHLMNKLNLKSGSIDMILTPDLEYVFLEVNPIGQFEQVAFPCNYNLFKQVALAL